jgi:hypothetical protein
MLARLARLARLVVPMLARLARLARLVVPKLARYLCFSLSLGNGLHPLTRSYVKRLLENQVNQFSEQMQHKNVKSSSAYNGRTDREYTLMTALM